ncbi:MAG: hypothetical protein ACD_2C00159G0001 [uncultured bacterium (gcode 4)]|uniref:Uncharacterized protein n=1 Tax=uncultured bacterium (gcode 4) TaxID=1234023 RepID=K2G5F2_9BACT|nr:MAG: hypothetical protein ACD_2C00159G0001 [uncultured bacterium (gcode 4)]
MTIPKREPDVKYLCDGVIYNEAEMDWARLIMDLEDQTEMAEESDRFTEETGKVFPAGESISFLA